MWPRYGSLLGSLLLSVATTNTTTTKRRCAAATYQPRYIDSIIRSDHAFTTVKAALREPTEWRYLFPLPWGIRTRFGRLRTVTEKQLLVLIF